MKEIQKILSHLRSAADKYEMIREGDRIAVGVSGGKDSLTLLCALAEMRRFYPVKYELCAITVDMGFPGMDLAPIKKLCDDLRVEYFIEKTEIAKIIFDIRNEKNPCSLCSRMRRGTLHDAVEKYGCNKIALGHHFDDVAETFMLNLFFEGRIGCFRPVTYLSRKNLTMIRPLISTSEKEIKYFTNKVNLPVIKSPCPADGNTERERMKQFLRTFDMEHKGLYNRITGAIKRAEIDGFKL